jgi:quinol-cytochrome oxidoreductase complex cytochrome b subunit
MLRYLSRIPLRKPLVVLVTVIFLVMFMRSHVTGIDIPPNTAGVASTFIGVVLAGYFASSAYESACGSLAREEEKANDENV